MSGATLTMSPGQLGAFIKRSVVSNRAAVDRGIRIAKGRAVTLLKERTPVDNGLLRAAWVSTARGVENSNPIAGIIEQGARPHKVSQEGWQAIYEWVLRHAMMEGNIGPATAKSGGRSKYGRSITIGEAGEAYDHEARDITWRICKRIERDGYIGTHFVEMAMAEISDYVAQEVQESIRRAMEANNG